MSRSEYDSLVSQRDRYRATTIRYRQVIRKQNEVIAGHQFALEDRDYQIAYLSKELTNATEARLRREDEFKSELLELKKANEGVYKANRELNAKVMATRKDRFNINATKGGLVMMTILSGTLLIARSHD